MKAFRHRIISCWHLPPITLVCKKKETNRKITSQSNLLPAAKPTTSYCVVDVTYKFSSLSSCSFLRMFKSRARPSLPKFCTQLEASRKNRHFQKNVSTFLKSIFLFVFYSKYVNKNMMYNNTSHAMGALWVSPSVFWPRKSVFKYP